MELAYHFKHHPGLNRNFRNLGSYEILKVIKTTCARFVPSNSIGYLETLVDYLLKLGVIIERGDHGPVNYNTWLQGVNFVQEVAKLCSFESLNNKCDQLLKLTTVSPPPDSVDYFHTILLHSQLVSCVAEQRKMLVTFLINLAGMEIRCRGSNSIMFGKSYKSKFRKGDKQAFIPLLDPYVQGVLSLRD